MTKTQVRGAIPGFSSLPGEPDQTAPASPIGEQPPTPVQSSPFGDQSRPVIPPVENPPTEEPQPSPPPRRNQRLRERLKQAIDVTPTTTSDTAGSPERPVNLDRSFSSPEPAPVIEKLTKSAATEVVLGGIGVAVLAAAVLVRMRYRGRRQLRTPSSEQEREIGRPLASLLMRHAGMHKSLPDLIDVLGVIGAVGNYANEGPLTTAKYAEQEMPHTEEPS